MKRNAMLTNNILTSDMLDIIFDGRNKDYGAYELRRSYSKRIGRAMLITGSIVVLCIGGMALANSGKKAGPQYKITDGVIISDAMQKQPEKLPEPEKPKPIEQPKVKEIAFVEPKIVDKEVLDNPPPSNDDLEKGKISDKNVDGTIDDGTVDNGPQNPDSKGTGIVPDKPKPEPDFVAIEIPAKFDGNWPAFLTKYLVPEVPVSNGAPAGRYKVEIKFTIDEKGNIISTEALTHLGYGLEEEAIRVIKKASGKWAAPFQNGVYLKATMRQTIIFDVSDNE